MHHLSFFWVTLSALAIALGTPANMAAGSRVQFS